jgi:glycosyltransferase involved in cell wall biosynthesis
VKIAFIDFVLDPAQPGASGLSDIVWNMARELAKLGDEVHIVGPYTVEPEPVPGVTVHRFTLPPIGYRNIVGHLLIVLKAWGVARTIPNLDVIHAPEYLSTGLIAPLSRIPVVLTTPGNMYERIANGNPFDWSATQVFKLAARSSARYCRLIDAISTDMAWWWTRTGAEKDRVAVIPHGVDTLVFRRMPDARQALGLHPETKLILYVGRLSSEKRIDVLLHAVAQIAVTHRHAELAIMGGGPQQQQLDALAASLGIRDRVTFHGGLPQRQLPLWYSAADAVVLPSKSEGLPRVMLEAMACGAAFFGTEISGVIDHIQDGENGFLAKPGDPAMLAQQLSRILSDAELGRQIGVNAEGYIRAHLSWPTVVRAFRNAISVPLEGRASSDAFTTKQEVYDTCVNSRVRSHIRSIHEPEIR